MSRRQDPADGSNDVKSALRRWGPPALLVLVLILFVSQNTEQVSVDVFTLSFTSPLWLMLVVFAALGAFIGWWLRREK